MISQAKYKVYAPL